MSGNMRGPYKRHLQAEATDKTARRRGPYKQYLMDEEAIVPRSTAFRYKQLGRARNIETTEVRK